MVVQKDDLTPDEEEALQEVTRGGLMQKVIPAKARDRLIKLGYTEQKLRGLVATTKGKLCTLDDTEEDERTERLASGNSSLSGSVNSIKSWPGISGSCRH